MDVFSAIKERRSVRTFLKKEIPEPVIDRLIDSLIWAPSAGNLQSRKFYLVRDNDLKKRLAEAALSQGFIKDAPAVFVCCADAGIGRHYGQRGIELYSIQDVSVSVMCMMLAACEQGLGTCWVGAFREEEVSRVMNIPENLRPVAIIPVGYPEKTPKPTTRVSKDEAVIYR
ncbi:MAG: nitroreductase family protein [Nitrospirae bacterium]|nr:nitroreductase family protein [Nitrospirota bacterium]